MPEHHPGGPRPLNIPVSLVDPGKELAALYMEVESEVAAAEAVDALRRRGVKVRGVLYDGDGEGIVLAIIDVGGVGRRRAEELVEMLEVMEGIRRAAFIDSGVEGFAAGGGYAGLRAAGARTVVMTERALGGLFNGVYDAFGDAAGAAFLYYAGSFSGRRAARDLAGTFGPEAALKVHTAILRSHGYASSIEVAGGEGAYRFEVKDSIECSLLSSRRGKTSHWLRGVFAGFLSEAMGGEWDVEEVECINEGSDRCVLEARRRQQSPPSSSASQREPGSGSPEERETSPGQD